MSLAFIHIGQCGNQLGQAFWAEMESRHASMSVQAPLTSGPGAQTTTKKKLPNSAAARKPYKVVGTVNTKQCIPYSLPDGSLPCVLVDSEPKVLHRCSRILQNKVPTDVMFIDKTGRGNNWAYGYNGRGSKKPGDLYGSRNLTESMLEGVRRTAERCDRFMGTVLFHSLAGGTGSGLLCIFSSAVVCT